MKKLIVIYILGILITFIAPSCNDIIDTEPESLISVASFWNTEDDAKGGLYAIYDEFRDFARYNLSIVGIARSEVMWDQGLQNAGTRIKYMDNTMNENDADLDWRQMYRVVNYTNLILKYVPEIDFTSENDKNNILAQAYAMRAYMYFVMARTWGDLPLETEPSEGYDPETTFKPRTPVNQIFELIKSDIDEANKLFSDNSYNAHRSIWSKPALNMLKAEVYLWTGKLMGGGNSDITTALAALNAAENSDLELLDDYASIFKYNNKGNKEIILAVNFAENESPSNFYDDMYLQPSDAAGLSEADVAVIGTPGGLNWWAPSDITRNQFSEKDQRRDASFYEIYKTVNGEQVFFTSVVLKCNGIEKGGDRLFLDDVVIYRYADLLLLKAEAKNALGQDPAEEMNKVRQRAYGSHFAEFEFVSGSKEANDDAILKERLLELAFEAKRWWDLVRFEKAFEIVPSLQGRESDQYLLLWPIPLSTLSLNSKLEQNPGYR